MVFGAAEEAESGYLLINNSKRADAVKKELDELGINAEIFIKKHIKGIKIRFRSEEDYNLYRLSSQQYQNCDWIDCVIVP